MKNNGCEPVPLIHGIGSCRDDGQKVIGDGVEGVSSAVAANLVIIVVSDLKHWHLPSMRDYVRELVKGRISVQKYLTVWLSISEISSRFL